MVLFVVANKPYHGDTREVFRPKGGRAVTLTGPMTLDRAPSSIFTRAFRGVFGCLALPSLMLRKPRPGTLQPCRRARQIAVTDATLTTTPPVGLTKDAREAWQLAITCAPRGVLTALDATVLERWARNYATYRKIAKKLDNEDMVLTSETGVTLNPLFNALIKIQQVLSAAKKSLDLRLSRARV